MNKNKNTELTASERISQKAESFFSKNYKKIIVVLAVVVVIVIVIAIATVVTNSQREERFTLVAEAEEEYYQLLGLDYESSDFTSASDSFLSKVDSLISKGGNGYPVVKAEYLKGLYYAEIEDYQSALTSFENVAKKSGENYLGSLSTFNAAAVAENQGNVSLALEYYNKVWDDWGTNAAESPKALFNIARIYEQQGDIELAKATYQQLIDQFGARGSEYAKLASARIVTL